MTRSTISIMGVQFTGHASRELVEFIVCEIGRTSHQRRNLRSELRAMFWEDLEKQRMEGPPRCGGQNAIWRLLRAKGGWWAITMPNSRRRLHGAAYGRRKVKHSEGSTSKVGTLA